MIQIKRIYDQPDVSDGYRVLIDRLWPRGVSRSAACLDDWLKDIAPSNELRTWFNHDPDRWGGFIERYREELFAEDNVSELKRLREIASTRTLTLLFAARSDDLNNAVALQDVLTNHPTE